MTAYMRTISLLMSLLVFLYTNPSHAVNKKLVCNFTSTEDVIGDNEYIPLGKVTIDYNDQSGAVLINLQDNDYINRGYVFSKKENQLTFSLEKGQYKSQTELWRKVQYQFDTLNGLITRDYESKVSLKSDASHSRQFGSCEIRNPNEYLCIGLASTYPFWEKDDPEPDVNGYVNVFVNQEKYKVRTGAQLELESQFQGIMKDSSPSEWQHIELNVINGSDNFGYKVNSKYSPGITAYSFDPELRRLMVNNTSKNFNSKTTFYECTKL